MVRTYDGYLYELETRKNDKMVSYVNIRFCIFRYPPSYEKSNRYNDYLLEFDKEKNKFSPDTRNLILSRWNNENSFYGNFLGVLEEQVRELLSNEVRSLWEI